MALTQVKSDGIATGAVTADQIATGAVTANDLEDSGVDAGTYGSSSAIPAITVDAKGRITSASTNSVTQVGGANGVDFNDNVKARFGTGNDLEIYHDGTNSWIRNATGELYFSGANVKFLNYAQNETMLWGTEDGAVQLYHDNSAKLATTSGGINVTGTVTNDGIQCDGNAFLDGTYVSFNENGYIRGDVSGTMTFQAGSNQNFRFRNNGHSTTYVEIGTGGIFPGASNTYDLGGTSLRWRNVYTNDLNLSNEGGSNDVDGTWGSWTIQEGEDDLFLLNRRNGKKYKFNLTEVN